MIPKIIHYCWFGRGEKPELAKRCIASWKKHCPDYEIKEWNEDNFDINSYPYAKEAYDKRRLAFVSDVVRLYALYQEGGIYMDTDVEVLKPLDRFLVHHAFCGFEDEKGLSTGIIASEKGGKWVKDNLDNYCYRHFVKDDGMEDLTTNVVTITNYMLPLGLKLNNTSQDFPGLITIYPKDYFSPKSYEDGKLYLTKNTYTIHHFAGSWINRTDRLRAKAYKIVTESSFLSWMHLLYHFIKDRRK